jgi:uncharacterized protein (TIGR01244 family)
MRALAILLAATFLAVGFPSQQQSSSQEPQTNPAPEYPSIRNFFRANAQFCTGGQPSMEDLARLKAEGVRAVLNLRRPSEYDAEEEAAKAKSLGFRYFTIPVDPAAPHDAQVEQFLRILAATANRPIFVHCATNNRVSAFWMIRRVLVDGWKVADAEEEARKTGLHRQNLIDFARSYIERHPRKPS